VSDPTLSCLLNKEQYEFLNTERGKLETWRATGAMNNLDPAWLKGAANIHQAIFNSQRPNTNCIHCIIAMCGPLLHQIHEYEKCSGTT
jgi:hypothetical protein